MLSSSITSLDPSSASTPSRTLSNKNPTSHATISNGSSVASSSASNVPSTGVSGGNSSSNPVTASSSMARPSAMHPPAIANPTSTTPNQHQQHQQSYQNQHVRASLTRSQSQQLQQEEELANLSNSLPSLLLLLSNFQPSKPSHPSSHVNSSSIHMNEGFAHRERSEGEVANHSLNNFSNHSTLCAHPSSVHPNTSNLLATTASMTTTPSALMRQDHENKKSSDAAMTPSRPFHEGLPLPPRPSSHSRLSTRWTPSHTSTHPSSPSSSSSSPSAPLNSFQISTTSLCTDKKIPLSSSTSHLHFHSSQPPRIYNRRLKRTSSSTAAAAATVTTAVSSAAAYPKAPNYVTPAINSTSSSSSSVTSSSSGVSCSLTPTKQPNDTSQGFSWIYPPTPVMGGSRGQTSPAAPSSSEPKPETDPITSKDDYHPHVGPIPNSSTIPTSFRLHAFNTSATHVHLSRAPPMASAPASTLPSPSHRHHTHRLGMSTHAPTSSSSLSAASSENGLPPPFANHQVNPPSGQSQRYWNSHSYLFQPHSRNQATHPNAHVQLSYLASSAVSPYVHASNAYASPIQSSAPKANPRSFPLHHHHQPFLEECGVPSRKRQAAPVLPSSGNSVPASAASSYFSHHDSHVPSPAFASPTAVESVSTPLPYGYPVYEHSSCHLSHSHMSPAKAHAMEAHSTDLPLNVSQYSSETLAMSPTHQFSYGEMHAVYPNDIDRIKIQDEYHNDHSEGEEAEERGEDEELLDLERDPLMHPVQAKGDFHVPTTAQCLQADVRNGVIEDEEVVVEEEGIIEDEGVLQEPTPPANAPYIFSANASLPTTPSGPSSIQDWSHSLYPPTHFALHLSQYSHHHPFSHPKHSTRHFYSSSAVHEPTCAHARAPFYPPAHHNHPHHAPFSRPVYQPYPLFPQAQMPSDACCSHPRLTSSPSHLHPSSYSPCNCCYYCPSSWRTEKGPSPSRGCCEGKPSSADYLRGSVGPFLQKDLARYGEREPTLDDAKGETAQTESPLTVPWPPQTCSACHLPQPLFQIEKSPPLLPHFKPLSQHLPFILTGDGETDRVPTTTATVSDTLCHAPHCLPQPSATQEDVASTADSHGPASMSKESTPVQAKQASYPRLKIKLPLLPQCNLTPSTTAINLLPEGYSTAATAAAAARDETSIAALSPKKKPKKRGSYALETTITSSSTHVLPSAEETSRINKRVLPKKRQKLLQSRLAKQTMVSHSKLSPLAPPTIITTTSPSSPPSFLGTREQPVASENAPLVVAEPVKKNKGGRPRKYPLPTLTPSASISTSNALSGATSSGKGDALVHSQIAVKKRGGRPRNTPLPPTETSLIASSPVPLAQPAQVTLLTSPLPEVLEPAKLEAKESPAPLDSSLRRSTRPKRPKEGRGKAIVPKTIATVTKRRKQGRKKRKLTSHVVANTAVRRGKVRKPPVELPGLATYAHESAPALLLDPLAADLDPLTNIFRESYTLVNAPTPLAPRARAPKKRSVRRSTAKLSQLPKTKVARKPKKVHSFCTSSPPFCPLPSATTPSSSVPCDEFFSSSRVYDTSANHSASY